MAPINGIELLQVRPGEVIKSKLVNDILTRLEILEEKVNALGDLGKVVINTILPPGQLRSGDDIEIHGANFGFVRGSNQVFFDGIAITSFKPGSNDNKLLVRIPNIPGMPQAGKNVILTVTNGQDTTTRTLALLPVAQPITSDVIDVFWDSVTPNPILGNKPATFGYRLRSRAAVSAIFTITPHILTAGFNAELQVQEANGEINLARKIGLAANEERAFLIHIPLVPNLPAGTSFKLAVQGAAGGGIGANTKDFAIGQAVIPPDATINLTPIGLTILNPLTALPDPSGGLPYSEVDRTISLKKTFIGRMALLAEFQSKGTYDIVVEKLSGADKWDVQLFDTDAQIVIDEGDFVNGPPARENLGIGVVPQDGASATGEIQLRVQRKGALSSQTRRFNLSLVS